MKKIIATLTIVSFLSFLTFPTVSNAETFGGRLTGVFYCNCSASLLLYIHDYKTGRVLPLVFGPGSNLLVGSPYGLYQIGSYTSGAGLCLFTVPHSCASMRSVGLIGGGLPGFGTS